MPGPTSPRTSRACFAAARSKANRCANSDLAGRAGRVEGLSACDDQGDIDVERTPACLGKIHRRPADYLERRGRQPTAHGEGKAPARTPREGCRPKAHSASWPSTEGYKNLLLYVDPDHHFVINAVVRAPGR